MVPLVRLHRILSVTKSHLVVRSRGVPLPRDDAVSSTSVVDLEQPPAIEHHHPSPSQIKEDRLSIRPSARAGVKEPRLDRETPLDFP